MAARWVTRLAWAYFALTLVAWWALVAKSEEWLPATLLAYGPRWTIGLPLLLLVPLTVLAWPRTLRTLAPLALSALVIVWPIMGGRVSLATIGKPIRPLPAEGALRVMTFNTFGGRAVAARLDETFALQPDVAAFQECGETLFSALQRVKGLYAVKYHSLCTVSRWPITRVDSMPRLENDRGSALAARHHIRTPSGTLLFVNVHFETARYGLESLMRKDGGLVPDNAGDIARMIKSVLRPDAAAARQLSFNTVTRTRESARAAQWATEGVGDTPVIVAGDFNLPVESSIYRRYWSNFRNAFETAGTGFGYTKSEGQLLRIRIDHVLGNATAPRATGAWLGPELGSDHRPVLVDFARGDRSGSVEPRTRR